MADLILRLVVDPVTGHKHVVIGYESEADALPIEHEDEHRRMVDAVIEGGARAAAERGDIVVERDNPAAAGGGAEAESAPVAPRESVPEGE